MGHLTELLVALLGVASSALRVELEQPGPRPSHPECPVPPGFCVVTIRNSELGSMKMALRKNFTKDIISRHLTNRGSWEIRHPRELGALAGRAIPANGTFLDIGANLGWYSLLFAKIGYNVIAIEPMLLNRQAFQATMCLNPDIRDRVQLVQAALVAPEDRNLQCVLYATATNRGNGILTCTANETELPCDLAKPGVTNGACEVVPTLTLDRLLKDQNPKSVDVVKMDIEGYECNVLRGGQSLFQKFHVKLLQAETKQQQVAECFAKEAKAHGYRMGNGVGQDDNRVMSSLAAASDETSGHSFITLSRPGP